MSVLLPKSCRFVGLYDPCLLLIISSQSNNQLLFTQSYLHLCEYCVLLLIGACSLLSNPECFFGGVTALQRLYLHQASVEENTCKFWYRGGFYCTPCRLVSFRNAYPCRRHHSLIWWQDKTPQSNQVLESKLHVTRDLVLIWTVSRWLIKIVSYFKSLP